MRIVALSISSIEQTESAVFLYCRLSLFLKNLFFFSDYFDYFDFELVPVFQNYFV